MKNPENHVLRSLPTEEYRRLAPYLEPISLQQNDVLSEVTAPITHGYFIESGLVSTLAVMTNGQSVEVGLLGNEGFAGFPILLKIAHSSSRLVVQISGGGMRIRAETLHKLLPRLHVLERLLFRFVYLQVLQMEQLAACNTLHEVGHRMARWLLMAVDRVRTEDLPLTHDQLARMLGARRASVSVAARTLQRAGAIDYKRGTLRILSRRKLEEAACECHDIVYAHFEEYLKSTRPNV